MDVSFFQHNGGASTWKDSIEAVEVQAEAAVAVSEEISALEKCTRQHVPNVDKNVKYHSSQQKENQSFAKNAIRRKRDINFGSKTLI